MKATNAAQFVVRCENRRDDWPTTYAGPDDSTVPTLARARVSGSMGEAREHELCQHCRAMPIARARDLDTRRKAAVGR